MDNDVGRLRRWEDSGAAWQVVARTSEEIVIALLTCDLGEEVGRLRSGDPDLLAYIEGRDRSDGGEPSPPTRASHSTGAGDGTAADGPAAAAK